MFPACCFACSGTHSKFYISFVALRTQGNVYKLPFPGKMAQNSYIFETNCFAKVPQHKVDKFVSLSDSQFTNYSRLSLDIDSTSSTRFVTLVILCIKLHVKRYDPTFSALHIYYFLFHFVLCSIEANTPTFVSSLPPSHLLSPTQNHLPILTLNNFLQVFLLLLPILSSHTNPCSKHFPFFLLKTTVSNLMTKSLHNSNSNSNSNRDDIPNHVLKFLLTLFITDISLILSLNFDISLKVSQNHPHP